jgi:hypothetical protein
MTAMSRAEYVALCEEFGNPGAKHEHVWRLARVYYTPGAGHMAGRETYYVAEACLCGALLREGRVCEPNLASRMDRDVRVAIGDDPVVAVEVGR